MSLHNKVVYINPYPLLFFYYIDIICLQWLMQPFIHSVDKLLSSFLPTTVEIKHIYEWILKKIGTGLLSGILAILTFPLAVCGFLTWLLIQWSKQPYRQSICTKEYLHQKQSHYNGKCYSFATTNICLLREYLCRFNNMTSPRTRAKKIGSRIKHSQLLCTHLGENEMSAASVSGQTPGCTASLERRRRSSVRANCFKERKPPVISPTNSSINHNIYSQFPDLDILFIQEAFCNKYAESLGRELHHVFPYIVYDVGVYSLKSNLFMINSGLMIASKYPVLKVSFDWYTHSTKQCRFASKGLLQVKVLLGKRNGKNLVGYLYNTHLQSYSGNLPVQSDQLDNIEDWTNSFRKHTIKPEDVVLFDIMAGDFNCDNLSPCDRDNWFHPLFKIYTDVCRERPGKDFCWTVGTEMRHKPLNDARIQTPEGLKQVLQDPRELQYYILDGVVECTDYSMTWTMPEKDKNGRQIWNPNGGRRRVDLVMYRSDHSHVKPLAMNAITQLAGLTDHIPYCLSIQIDEKKLHETI